MVSRNGLAQNAPDDDGLFNQLAQAYMLARDEAGSVVNRLLGDYADWWKRGGISRHLGMQPFDADPWAMTMGFAGMTSPAGRIPGRVADRRVFDVADSLATEIKKALPDTNVNVVRSAGQAGNSAYIKVSVPGRGMKRFSEEIRVSDHSVGPGRLNDYVAHVDVNAPPGPDAIVSRLRGPVTETARAHKSFERALDAVSQNRDLVTAIQSASTPKAAAKVAERMGLRDLPDAPAWALIQAIRKGNAP